jgi:hypothetical protein
MLTAVYHSPSLELLLMVVYYFVYYRLQTKGVKSIVSIQPSDAAWYAAVGGVGAAIIGTGAQ